MRLVGKASTQGYFAQRCFARYHEMTGLFQTHPGNVSKRRFTEGQFEFSTEVGGAQTSDRTEISDVNRSMQVAVNVVAHTNDLPGHQTSSLEVLGTGKPFDLRMQNV